MTYSEFLNRLTPYCEEEFAAFQSRLIFTQRKIIGIRTPILRKLAKEFREHLDELFSYPDEIYEVTFIKLTAVSFLPYETFVAYLPAGIALMDNWALCDCFKAKCIKNRKREFLSELEKLFAHGGEYFERYVLVTLLSEYTDSEYLPVVEGYLRRADTTKYYIRMAAAWLLAEVLIKNYEGGVAILKAGFLQDKTHNKAIQKARESYRLTKSQKEFLSSLKK